MAKEVLCQACGTVGKPRVRNRGSSAIEIILWLLFVVPSFCYSLWRMGRKDKSCRTCRSSAVIPVDSPMAQQWLQQQGGTAVRPVAAAETTTTTPMAAPIAPARGPFGQRAA